MSVNKVKGGAEKKQLNYFVFKTIVLRVNTIYKFSSKLAVSFVQNICNNESWMLSSFYILIETDISRTQKVLSKNKQSQERRIFLLTVLVGIKDIFNIAAKQVMLIRQAGRDPQHEKSFRGITTSI